MTESLDIGLYETLITAELESRLATLDDRLTANRTAVHRAEVANRIALHLSRVIERVLASLKDENRVQLGVRIARDLLARLDDIAGTTEEALEAPVEPAAILESILDRLPDGSVASFETPLIPLLDTTLLTNAPGEPRCGHQIRTEIDSADRIDVVMAFIRKTGVDPLRDALRRHSEKGRDLRVLTTTYTGSTERRALDILKDAGADIRVSYDTSATRLHAKAWLFHRRTGFSTAYIGSSNLTHSAQVFGLEWNVRLSGARNPDVIHKVSAVFDSYWESGDFRPYDAEEFDDRNERPRDKGLLVYLSPAEVAPNRFRNGFSNSWP